MNDASATPAVVPLRGVHCTQMHIVALLCLAHASALGRKKTNGPSVKVSATLAVDKKVVAVNDALFKKRTAARAATPPRRFMKRIERTGYADA